MAGILEPRVYQRQKCITFRKTSERFGGLSNMAGGYPLMINGIRILTSEALYQACRFPHLPDVQKLIIEQRSPMTAKMKSKLYCDKSRPDWDIVRTKIMRWCLQVKLVQNWEKFSQLLLDTEDLPIVEYSKKDNFWGAMLVNEETLTGANVLGRLLMQLREQIKSGEITSKTIVKPPPISNILLYRKEIGCLSINDEYSLNNDFKLAEKLAEKASNSEPEIILQNGAICELNSTNGKNGLHSSFRGILTEVTNEPEKYDAFQIMLPHLENLLTTERTDKELAEMFVVPLKLMRSWLERAVKLGKVKKLSKPVKYVVESQLSLFN